MAEPASLDDEQRESKSPIQKNGVVEVDDSEDPIIATYSVFLKPQLPANRKLIVLQYVNKTAQDPTSIRPPRITELRVKPDTGMYEVDMPIDTSQAYDQAKGVKWGTNLQKSMENKKGGSLGLAGGFGIGGPAIRGAGGRRGGGSDENEGPLTWPEALRQDKALRTQTLGGGRGAEEEKAKYMVGVFQGNSIHLTPVSSLVHLRPVPHHVDAVAEQERASRAAPAGSAPGGADKGAGRAIHMTIKNAMDDDGVTTETIADRLRAVQTEHWRRMKWVRDDSEAAWEAFNDCLLLPSGAAPTKPSSKGKELAIDAAAAADDSGAPGLAERVASLQTDWEEEEYLRAVSDLTPDDKKPSEKAATQAGPQRNASKDKGKAVETRPAVIKDEPTEEPRKRPGRPPKSAGTAMATASAPRRGRARVASGGASAPDAMRID